MNAPIAANAKSSPLSDVRIVAAHEFDERVHARSFLIVTIVFAALAVIGIMTANHIEHSDPTVGDDTIRLALPSSQPELATLSSIFDVRPVASADDAVSAVQTGDADAAIVTTADGVTQIIALTEAPSAVVAALTKAPQIRLLNPDGAVSQTFLMVVPLAFGVIFLLIGVMAVNSIAVNAVIEKQTSIVEILVCSIRPSSLLAGKVIGNTLAALIQTTAIASVALVSLIATQNPSGWPGDLLTPIVWYIPFFIIGFLLMAGLAAGLASLVARQEDVATAVSPLTAVMSVAYIAPYILAITENWSGLQIASYIPLVSIVAMPTRIALKECGAAEPVISLAIMAIATIIVIELAGRIYQNSILLTSKKTTLRRALGAK